MRTVEKIVFERDNMQVIQTGDKFFGRVFEGGETFESEDFNTMERAKFRLGIIPTTEENNRMIAEFLGYSQPHPDYNGATYWYKEGKAPLTILSFNYDWNWLMEVVDRIESIDDGAFDVNILKNGTQIVNYAEMTTIVENVADVSFESKIEHVYKAVVEFINIYNQQ